MKLTKALLTSVWVATTASSNQDQDNPPGAAVNDGVCSHLFSCMLMRHLVICHTGRIESSIILTFAHHSISYYIFQNGPRPVGGIDSETQKNSREDGVFDIDMTGEAHYYDDAADNFELCNVKTEETCYYYDDTGILTYYCAMVSFVTIHNYIIYSVER